MAAHSIRFTSAVTCNNGRCTTNYAGLILQAERANMTWLTSRSKQFIFNDLLPALENKIRLSGITLRSKSTETKAETVWTKQLYLLRKSRPYLIDLNGVTEEQGVLLLVFLGVFINEVGEAQADTEHHA